MHNGCRRRHRFGGKWRNGGANASGEIVSGLEQKRDIGALGAARVRLRRDADRNLAIAVEEQAAAARDRIAPERTVAIGGVAADRELVESEVAAETVGLPGVPAGDG